MEKSPLHPETNAVHAGKLSIKANGPIQPPIFQVSSLSH